MGRNSELLESGKQVDADFIKAVLGEPDLYPVSSAALQKCGAAGSVLAELQRCAAAVTELVNQLELAVQAASASSSSAHQVELFLLTKQRWDDIAVDMLADAKDEAGDEDDDSPDK